MEISNRGTSPGSTESHPTVLGKVQCHAASVFRRRMAPCSPVFALPAKCLIFFPNGGAANEIDQSVGRDSVEP